ncbi:hypothetical protein DFJ74DRAFT_704628 [Hyaloraphidium curvatum]|nr:hypothetical protein DFJ74DRAFT_704628 [Hyaloraphidium curvatum]
MAQLQTLGGLRRHSTALLSSQACFLLSCGYRTGNGVPLDKIKADYWLDRHFELIDDDDPECGPYKALHQVGYFGSTSETDTVRMSMLSAIASACSIGEDDAKAILAGSDPQKLDRAAIFGVLNWLIASGQADGALLLARRISRASCVDDGVAVIEAIMAKVTLKKNRTMPPEVAIPDEPDLLLLRWILCDSESAEPAADVMSRASHVSERFRRLASNLSLLGGHGTPVSTPAPGEGKREQLAKLACLGCGKVSDKKRFQRCKACGSAAVVYCGPACQRKDWKGPEGVHGVTTGWRAGKSECARIGEMK